MMARISVGLLMALTVWGQKGRVWEPEGARYKDPLSGQEVWELTGAADEPSNLYYHFSNFTADDRYLVFASKRTGQPQVFLAELATGRLIQVTEGDGVAATAAMPHPEKAEILYYLRGPVVWEVELGKLQERRVGEIPPPRMGGYGQPTLSHDGRSLALVKQRDEWNWEIGLMDLRTGAWTTVVRQGFRIGHVQHHPLRPLLFYVWETGGYAPQRTWLVNADGTGNRPFYYTTDPKQWATPLKEWVTHEAWVRKTGEMTLIVDRLGIVVADADGKGRLLPGHYWHVAANEAGTRLVADDFEGRIWLLDPRTQNRRLVASGVRDAVRSTHAHASFDRAGRRVIFNTGRSRSSLAVVQVDGLLP
jgi:oligogalacturonide lyase